MRDQQLQSAKQALRGFFAAQSVEYLTRVVDECRAGTFCYSDGCHCIRGLFDGGYEATTANVAAQKAELALYLLGGGFVSSPGGRWDAFEPLQNYLGRQRTLPLVLREIKKRHRVPTAPPVEVACE